MSKPVITKVGDNYLVTYQVSAVGVSGVIDLLRAVHRFNVDAMNGERSAMRADADIASLKKAKAEKMELPQ